MGVPKQIHLVIPPGTKVITRVGGRVGVVVHAPAAPEHGYRVRFADGQEGTYHRSHLTIFKHADAEIALGPDSEEFHRFVIFRCIVGSTAFGLNDDDSDVDRRGFFLPPAELHWGIAGVPEQIETDQEECYWEIEKFIRRFGTDRAQTGPRCRARSHLLRSQIRHQPNSRWWPPAAGLLGRRL